MAWTLQTLIDANLWVHAYCGEDTSHNKKVDLEGLRDRLGPDAPAMAWDLAARLKCPFCGSKRITFTYTPNRTGPEP